MQWKLKRQPWNLKYDTLLVKLPSHRSARVFIYDFIARQVAAMHVSTRVKLTCWPYSSRHVTMGEEGIMHEHLYLACTTELAQARVCAG